MGGFRELYKKCEKKCERGGKGVEELYQKKGGREMRKGVKKGFEELYKNAEGGGGDREGLRN